MFKKSHEWLNDDTLDQEVLSAIADQLSECIREVFLSVDLSLIDMCKARKLHYVSSTAVTVLLWRNVLTVAHVGDSRACIAKMTEGILRPEWLTVDHKPNTPSELQRIESCGGTLVWLHGVKPYIRCKLIILQVSGLKLTVSL
jgi:protein phosphatase 2C family protein 2/3